MPGRKRKITDTGDAKSEKSIKLDDNSIRDDLELEDQVERDLVNLTEDQNAADILLKIVDSKADVGRVMPKLGSAKLAKLWSNCHIFVAETILAVLESPEDVDRHEKVLEACVKIAKAMLELELILGASELVHEMEKSVFLLHESVPSRLSSTVKYSIAKLCEAWFTKELPNRDNMSINAIDFLLRKTIEPSGTKADIKRILALTTKNEVFKVKLCEGSDIKSRVLVAVQSPTFYRSSEGQRFITNLFSTKSVAWIKEVHKAFKAILPGCSRSDAGHIGEIYFKSWSNSLDDSTLNKVIEEHCIQDFMYHCVPANKKVKLFEPLLTVLTPFHRAKNSKTIQKSVHKLWEPLLWRHLKVANSDVRINAIQILTEAFPVEDPEAELQVKAERQQVQVQAFADMLKDEVAEVRVSAVNGASHILSKFWLILEAGQIQQLMMIMIKLLANDMSSPKVRQSVVKAMTTLVKTCPRCHLYLKKILPKLKDLIFDSNETVRLAMVELLGAVKAIKSIQFWAICPLNDLLEKMASDKKCVSGRIANLLFNSFFPLEQNEEAKLERCVYLIKTHADASRRFYLLIEKQVSLHDIVKFMLAILVNLKKHLPKEIDDDHEDKENVSINIDVTETTCKDGSIRLINDSLHQNLQDTVVVRGLIDVVCILWMTRCKELSQNAEYRSLLEKKSSKILTLLFKAYKSCQVHRSIIYLSSFLPHSASLTMASFCLSRLKSSQIDPHASMKRYPNWTDDPKKAFEDEAVFTTYVDALCNWRRGDDILEMILEWLKKDLEAKHGKAFEKKQRNKTKGVRFDQKNEGPRAGFGLFVLRYLLSHAINRSILLKKNFQQLQDIRNSLEGYLPLLDSVLEIDAENHDAPIDLEGKFEVLGSAWTVYLQLEAVLHLAQKPEEHNEIMDWTVQHLNWAKDKVLPMVDQSELADHVLSSLMMFTSNLVTLNLCQERFAQESVEIILDMLEDANLSKPFLPFMAEMAQWITYNRKPTGSLVTLCSKIIGKFQAEDHSKETYSDIKKHFALFLEIALAKFDPLSRDLVLKSIRQAMLDSTADAISKNERGILIEKQSSNYLLIELICSKKKALKLTIPSMIADVEQENNIAKLTSYLTFIWTVCQAFKSSLPKTDLRELLSRVESRATLEDSEEDPDLVNNFKEMVEKIKLKLN